MMAISLPLIRVILSLVGKFVPLLVSQRISAFSHRLTYRPAAPARNVIVLGGSYTGVQLAKRLAETLPTGYRVILVERKTHLNHLFNFPRYSVVKRREERAFIPYDGIGKGWVVPDGIFEMLVGEVVRIDEDAVELHDGQIIPFAFLAICTGATLPSPANVYSSGKEESCAELQDFQLTIEKAQKIAVVGGGAVGVQISGDIKSFYPDKEVVLVHSREWLLSGFGRILGDHVRKRYEASGINVKLGERPVLGQKGSDGKEELIFKDGRSETFDLVIPCTGQKPNSSLIAQVFPHCISPTSGEILVHPTLQIRSTTTPPTTSPLSTTSPKSCPPNIFALGDVALTHGPKMARASFMQAEVAIANILSLIHDPHTPLSKLSTYEPSPIEGSVNLSLGADESVSYLQVDDSTEFLWPGKGKGLDLEVKKMWWMMGVGDRYERENGGAGKTSGNKGKLAEA